MLDLQQVHALAIFMLGAFFVVLITAITYVITLRDRLLDITPAPTAEPFDPQRIDQISATLVQHTTYLKAAAGSGGDTFGDLTEMLDTQSTAVTRLVGLMHDQANQLAGINNRLDRLETGTIQAQAAQLTSISKRLDEWAIAQTTTSTLQNTQLQDHARVLAELDRELAAQAQAVEGLTGKIDEHNTHLLRATTERQNQTSLIERVLDQVSQLVPSLSNVMAPPPRTGQDRLTNINGIGPVYSGRLYTAGIHTYQQLAAMSEAELNTIIQRKGVNTWSWIEQAQILVNQQASVEAIAE